MAESTAKGTRPNAHTAWTAGLRARLLLAFFGITAFAVLAALAGIYATWQVGGRLKSVEQRASPTLTALELSRSAERIIAAAPALLAAGDRQRRDEISAELEVEVDSLNGRLRDLRSNSSRLLPLNRIEPIVSSLTVNLAALEDLVARRLRASERLSQLRRGIFEANRSAQRLLAPWLEIINGEISLLIDSNRDANPNERSEAPQRLASLIELQRATQKAQRQFSAAIDLLADASTADESERLSVLAFQLRLALRDLQETATGLDPKLQPLFLEEVANLQAFADGPNTITEARERELALIGEGESLLVETGSLSNELTGAVDRLGSAAKKDIGGAIRDALAIQKLNTRILVVVVALSLVTSVLIVWLYVGRNIVHRLSALSDSMLAIADGKVRTPVVPEGDDEIAAMGRAVEILRRNTQERDGLLAEKAQAAERLEKEVKERTAELEIANAFKSRFLAAASHDLRQPLHALNLFIAQLGAEPNPDEQSRILVRIDAAVDSMNDLFGALLDMSKLEAGLLEPELSVFPVCRLLTQIESTFAAAATEKELRLAVVASSAWIRSDFILLERILLNLVSNAVRHTARGGIVVGCRRRGGLLRIDVCDTGPGIPEDQQKKVFGEFYQVAEEGQDRRSGLGLGLSIVERLGRLLDHPVELASRPGRGSRFSFFVPLAEPKVETAVATSSAPAIIDPVQEKLIVMIDDDPLVLDAMRGILQSWGASVVTAASEAEARAALREGDGRPDLIISDVHLAGGADGVETIARIRQAFGETIPAFLISGDTTPERLRHASESGLDLLHKPVSPMRLRTMINQLLKSSADRVPEHSPQ